MAFVFRSQQSKEKSIKTEDILYTNEKIEKKLLENKCTKNYNNNHKSNSNFNLAFSSSSKKEPSYYYHEKNPGPGSYDPQLSKKSLDNLNEDTLDENNKLFISKETRFKKNEYSNDLPGPGKYYKEYIFNHKNHSTSRRGSGILYKKSKKYFINSIERKITIPSKENNFGYSIDNNGDAKLKKDPQINNKFNGTYKNSIGPGQYSIENSYFRKNNALDWSKNIEENFLLKKNNYENNNNNNYNKEAQTEPNNIKEYYNEELSPYLVSSLNSIIYNKEDKSKKERKIKNIIKERSKKKYPNNSINNSIKFYSNDDNILGEDYSEFKNKVNKNSYIKESISPGPGKYTIIDEFDMIANNKKNQHFGSNKDRGLLLTTKKKIIKIELRKKNNNNDQLLNYFNPTPKEENNKKLDNNIFKENSLKLIQNNKNDSIKNFILLKKEGIKDQYINNKNELNSKLGPGTYNPDIQKKIFSKEIQNFGSLSKRFIKNDNIDSNKSNFSSKNNKQYNSLVISNNSNEDKKEKKIIHFKSQIPLNILKRNAKGISFLNIENNKNSILNENRKSPPVGYYSPEKKLSIEYDVKLSMKNNEKSPGFGEREKRFYEKENNENEYLGVGSYNILTPEKKFIQRKVPFIFGIEKGGKGSILDNHLINNSLGPGIYKYNDKNEWNKKSFNKLFSS